MEKEARMLRSLALVFFLPLATIILYILVACGVISPIPATYFTLQLHKYNTLEKG